MTAAVQLRRLLYEMTRLEKVVYATGAAVYFVLGLVAVPLFYGRFLRHVDQAVGRTPLAKEISDSIPFDNPFFLAVAAIVAISSIGAGALQMAVIVRLVAWLPPICERIDRLYESIGLPAFGKWPSLVLLVFINGEYCPLRPQRSVASRE